MSLQFNSDRRRSAVRWFAVAAVVLSAASMAGAHGLAWLTRDGHLAVIAVRAAPEPTRQANPGIDPTPTGSIKKKTPEVPMH